MSLIKKFIILIFSMSLLVSCVTTSTTSFNGVNNKQIENELAKYSAAQINKNFTKSNTIFMIDTKSTFSKALAYYLRNMGFAISDNVSDEVTTIKYALDIVEKKFYTVILVISLKKLSRAFVYDEKNNKVSPAAEWSFSDSKN